MDGSHRGHLEHLAVPQCDECVWVELLEVVTLQMDQLQLGKAVESLRADELNVVVVQVKSQYTVQAFECVFVDFPYFVEGHFQYL